MKVKATARCTTRGHAFAATFVSAAFLWAIALGASPGLHAKVHRDANSIEHSCAVTFIASGSVTHSPPAQLIDRPIPPVQFASPPALSPAWVESPFLAASIFEHAPPAHS